MSKLPNFFEYVKSAKDFIATFGIIDYEKYFLQLEHSSQSLDYLNQVLFIIDFRTNEFAYLSPNCFEVNGYTNEELLNISPLGYVNMFHPTDAHIITTKFFIEGLAFTRKIKDVDHTKIKTSYSYRFLQKDGSYKTLLQQFSQVLFDEDFNPLVIMGTTTDISEIHTKPELFCRIHYQSSKGKWDKVYERIYSLTEQEEDYGLTPKEMEIIKFVHKGLSSKEIANLTNRSEETIKSQRKSIVAKTHCQTMTDVVVLATKNGWITN